MPRSAAAKPRHAFSCPESSALRRRRRVRRKENIMELSTTR